MQTSSLDRTSTRSGLRLLLFAKSRASIAELAEQLRQHIQGLAGQYPAKLEVVLLEDHPYLAEHYKLVVTPALVKAEPLPAQVLAGEDLSTQLEVWWPRWQGQAALASNQEDAGQDPTPPPTTEALLQMSEEVFLLRQERAQLREQLHFKDRILAMLVHDLRSPLTATALAVETLQQGREGSLDKELEQQLFDHARQQLRKMDGMITDILESARGTTSELTIRAVETQLPSLCQSVIEELWPRIRGKQLQFQSDIPTDLPSVQVDGDKIRQVLFNLLDNAIKYTPAGGSIRLNVLHRTSQKVQVTVSDTGPGIPAADQENIFFDLVRLSRDQQQEGYGIGLSLCRRIVRAHYGQIWVESTPGKGSSFHFTLPVYRV
ncbi:histidine kinase [Thermostichus vulcanus]|uniref:Adaptive-response sensory-kinase SasA n=1 Tax=Thermostichus vulcanus str. 'Rupite' TaxID=2813851 RepID=A0ABT0C7C9_THEVL|nr:histidine kinase [Thermostichus vulcanus]MCJ2541639.1 histidine kinase [Thermostichus vulcanus str. 'Rupite']